MDKKNRSLIVVVLILAIFAFLSAGYSYGKQMAFSDNANCELQKQAGNLAVENGSTTQEVAQHLE